MDLPDVPPPIPDAPLLAVGAPCSMGEQCASSICTEGVCCGTLCSGTCQSCKVPGSEGQCKPVPAEQDPRDQCPKDEPASCGRDGTCDGKGACRLYPADTLCAPGACINNVQNNARTCDGNGVCRPGTTMACGGACVDGTCTNSCTMDRDCQPGAYCKNNKCTTKLDLTDPCSAGNECASGHCFDGICCGSPCGQSCFSCKVPGFVGECVAVPAGGDLRNDCADEGAPTCKKDGTCDGKGSCRLYLTGTPCGGPSCAENIAIGARTCNGIGTCGAPPTPCTPYVCDATACKTACAGPADCQPGFICDGTSCVVNSIELHWRFDETTGTMAADSSGHNHPGLYTSYPTTGGAPAPSTVVPPKIMFPNPQSRLFVATKAQGVRLVNAPAALKPPGALTISVWYRTNKLDASGSELVSLGDNYMVRLRPGDIHFAKRVNLSGTGTWLNLDAVTANHFDNQWHHIAVVTGPHRAHRGHAHLLRRRRAARAGRVQSGAGRAPDDLRQGPQSVGRPPRHDPGQVRLRRQHRRRAHLHPRPDGRRDRGPRGREELGEGRMPDPAAKLVNIPLDWYRQMRATQPVAWDAKFGSWNVFRYDDAQRILNDHLTFSSQARAGATGLPSIVGMDVPRHRQLRGLINQAFTPRMAEQLAPRITEVASELIEQARPRGRIDLIQDFAYPLPIRIIAELLGIPVEEQATFRRWSETLITGPRTDAVRGRSYAQERADSLRDLNAYFQAKLDERRKGPRQDLMSRLLAAEVDGERLGESDLLEFCRLLLIAGYETTACLIGSTALSLHEHPDVADELRGDPALIPGAIEEALRCYPSVAGTMRVATADVEIAGQRIEKGQAVIVWIGSANYDEAHFAEPERFDPRRAPNRHLAFGFGIHFCVGAPLARLEARLAVSLLLERLPRLERDPGEPVEPVDSPFLFGVKHLHVVF